MKPPIYPYLESPAHWFVLPPCYECAPNRILLASSHLFYLFLLFKDSLSHPEASFQQSFGSHVQIFFWSLKHHLLFAPFHQGRRAVENPPNSYTQLNPWCCQCWWDAVHLQPRSLHMGRTGNPAANRCSQKLIPGRFSTGIQEELGRGMLSTSHGAVLDYP